MPKKKRKATLPKELTTVTPLSKLIALVLFVALPFIGFYFGVLYQQVDVAHPGATPTTSPIAIQHCTDLSCLMAQAKTCQPAEATWDSSRTDPMGSGKKLPVHMQVGITGVRKGVCQVYFKDLIQSENTYNYRACSFRQENDLVAFIGKLKNNSPVASDFAPEAVLDDSGFVLISNEGNCDEPKAVLDASHKSIEYVLLEGESDEDASQNFGITLSKMNWGNDATIQITKNNQEESFTLEPGQEKTSLGYTVKLTEFGQKNTGLDLKPPKDLFENAAWIIVSKAGN